MEEPVEIRTLSRCRLTCGCVPLIEEVRPMISRRLLVPGDDPDTRLFTPRGGRMTTAVLRDATHWDEVVRARLRPPAWAPATPHLHRAISSLAVTG
jgi:hypothetical protein